MKFCWEGVFFSTTTFSPKKASGSEYIFEEQASERTSQTTSPQQKRVASAVSTTRCFKGWHLLRCLATQLRSGWSPVKVRWETKQAKGGTILLYIYSNYILIPGTQIIYLSWILYIYIYLWIIYLVWDVFECLSSLKLTAKAPENGWLEYFLVSLNWPCQFSGANCWF